MTPVIYPVLMNEFQMKRSGKLKKPCFIILLFLFKLNISKLEGLNCRKDTNPTFFVEFLLK